MSDTYQRTLSLNEKCLKQETIIWMIVSLATKSIVKELSGIEKRSFPRTLLLRQGIYQYSR